MTEEVKNNETPLEATEEVSTAVVETVGEATTAPQAVEEDAHPLGLGSDGQFVERVVHISRVAKVVKGGRRFSFSALVVCGDGQGKVGFALGKANEVPDAIRKGVEKARKRMVSLPLAKTSIPHDVIGEFGAAKVILKRAAEGTGVIAGGPVRAIFEAAGVHNILTKCIGTNNPHNVVRATIDGILQLTDPEQRRKLLREVAVV